MPSSASKTGKQILDEIKDLEAAYALPATLTEAASKQPATFENLPDKPAIVTYSGRTKQVIYTSNDGRKYLATVPEEVDDGEAVYGPKVGPPDLTSLGLPQDLMVRLHNALFDRGVHTWNQARHARNDLLWALQTALSFNVERILEIYYNAEHRDE